jgi:hypothetical protein
VYLVYSCIFAVLKQFTNLNLQFIMAKNSLFWGKARGKLGEIVLYRAGGEQRSRTYVKRVKNPKSLAQMTQRVKLGSLVSFFRTTANVLRYSFPNRPQRQSGFNAFVAESMPVASTALTRKFADKGFSVPLNYHISKGNVVLPAGSLTLGGVSGDRNSWGVYLAKPSEYGDVGPYNDATLEDVAEHVDDWLEGNPEFSGTLPMKFNICIIISEEIETGCLQSVRILNVDRSSGTVEISGNIQPTMSGTKIIGLAEIGGGDYLVFAPGGGTNASLLFCGVFISYTDVNGKLAVSSAQMQNVIVTGEGLLKYQESGDIYNQAIQELRVGAQSVLSTN